MDQRYDERENYCVVRGSNALVVSRFASLMLFITVVVCVVMAAGLCFGGQEEFAPLFPFVISHDAPDNVTSMAHLLDAPAGKHGFVRVENGGFATDAGPIKFNATNLTGPANFPSHEDADRLAARLARFGINCVRLHYFDARYGNFLNEPQTGIFGNDDSLPEAFAADPEVSIPFDPTAVDCLDYLIAALKKRGIYVNINLHVARFPKGYSYLSPRMISSEKEYAKTLLTHTNPYTHLAYTDESSVAMIEINNENKFIRNYRAGKFDKLPDAYAAEFRNLWNVWLRKKYGSTTAVLKAWKTKKMPLGDKKQTLENGTIAILKHKAKVPPEVKSDFYRFLIDTEKAYWMGMAEYIKNELKAQCPISGTQLGYSPPFIQAELDYVDIHSYWCHPHNFGPNWRIGNTSMVNSMHRIQHLAKHRVLNKPYTISEYNHPFPNQYGAEGQPMLRAYGALHGWDGVFEYTWHHRHSYEPGWNSYFFSISERTDVLAHMPACAAMYLRGDVQEAKLTIAAAADYDSFFEKLVTSSRKVTTSIENVGFSPSMTLVHKTGVDISGKAGTDPASIDQGVADGKVLLSDTGELCWNREEPDAGYFTVNTTGTKLFTGFPKNRTIRMGDVSLKIGKTRLDWATVSLVSRHAEGGFGENGKTANILLAATGEASNNGMELEKDGKKVGAAEWGTAPFMVEGIPAVIELPSEASRTKCYAINPSGERMKHVPVEKSGNGSRITIGPDYRTIWYEIEVR